MYTGFIKWEWVIHQSYAYHENTQKSMDVQTEALPTPTTQQYRTNELPQVYCLSLILNRFTQYISLGLCFISMSARRAYSIQNTMDIWNCWANNNTYRHHDVQVFSPTFSASRGKKNRWARITTNVPCTHQTAQIEIGKACHFGWMERGHSINEFLMKVLLLECMLIVLSVWLVDLMSQYPFQSSYKLRNKTLAS